MAYIPPLNGGRINASATGNTAGALSVISTGTMVLAGGNNITLSQNANTLTISGIPAFSAGVSNLSNDSGNTGMLTNRLVLAGGNNITLSQSTNASGATVSINGTNGGGGIALITSNTTYSSGSVQFSNAGGALTIATTTGQQLNFSVPQTTSVVGSGIVNLSSNGASVTISAPAFSAGISSNSTVSNQLILAAGNNITLSQSTNATGATVSIGANGVLTTQSYNGAQFTNSTANSTMPIVWAGNSNGSGNITMGLTGSTVTASAAGGGGGVALYDGAHSITSGTANIITAGAITASITNQSLSLSVPGTSSIVGGGIVSLSTAGAGVTISAPAFSAGVSNLSNDSGNTGMLTNRLVLAGANNITLSQSTNASGATISISGGAGGGGGGVALYDGAHSISSGTASIAVSGGIGATITNQTLSLSAPQTSSVVGGGIVNFSTNGASATISAPAFSAGIASNSTVTNQMLLTAGNTNITLSQSTNATGATVSIYGGAGGGGGGVAIAGAGTTYTSGTANFVTAGGAITIGSSTNGGSQSLNFSVPATSSLVGANGISISTNGSTISVMPTTVSAFVNMTQANTSSQTLGAMNAAAAGSVQFFPVSIPSNLAFDAVRVAFAASYVTNTNAGSQTISHSFGLYSQNVSTLSLISSNSMGYSISNSSVSATVSLGTATGTAGYSYGTVSASTTAQLQSFFGSNSVWHMVDLQFGGAMTLTPGIYWLAMNKKESSSSTNVGMSLGLAGNIMTTPNLMAPFGSASSAMTSVFSIKGPYPGFGAYTATSNGIPSSAAFSNINHSLSIMPFMTFLST